MVGLGLFAVVCLLDRLIGQASFFSFLYLVPIFLAAWYLGVIAGEGVALLSYFGMVLAHTGVNGRTLGDSLRDINSLIALIFFAVSAFVVSRVSNAFKREHDLSTHDALTEVFNRREFFHLAEVERLRAIRYGRAITVVYIDLDDFKQVNDRFGHAAGDTLLVTAAKTIRDCVRATDIVARLGGDEFILLLEETGSEDARLIVAKLRDSLADQLAQSSCPVKASMGVMTFTVPPASVDAMVHAADELMYAAKNSGGDKAIFRVSQQPNSADSRVAGA